MCLFCSIAAGEIPSQKVYEDAEVLAFRDIHPQAPTHILVIPKAHLSGCADITPENSHLTARCFEVIGQLIRENGLETGARIISNCGPDAGQTVGHLHFHLLSGKKMSDSMV